ncbi:hypothetical protein RI129_012855 [Pyrocoelia pectoralis]|uniref:Glucose-methanol-choline oxidoreductase N-terminal domain-containing protein n=1 Tax=Pyrocoelia pectoralis TaxID=417401 RepID=A0AAN7UUK5_9COLE
MDQEAIGSSFHEATNNPISSLFLVLINTLVANKRSLGSNADYPSDYGPRLNDGNDFDFIIVGAGSAGSVVASRLSENRSWKILLIETGSYPSLESEVPALTLSLQKTKEDWNYEYEPSAYVRFKEKMPCPRGKGLGGSSLINYFLYTRGNRDDYDNWAKSGNVGWDSDSLFQFHRRIENIQGVNSHKFGTDGKLKLTKLENEPLIPSIVDAYKELGYPHDYNDGNPLGRSTGILTVSNGRRQNVAKAYLGMEVKDRSNLFVVLNAHVTKVLIDTSLSASGVEVRLGKKLLTIHSKKEVILSAGAVNSPQILMNSGIGPKTHLEGLGIKVLKDLPVGENLQDHALFPGLFYKLQKSALIPVFKEPNIDNLYDYLIHGKGPLTALGTIFVGFVNPKNDSKLPSIEIPHIRIPEKLLISPNSYVAETFGFPQAITDTLTKINEMNPITIPLVLISYPKSKGRIQLRSSDPFDAPLIFPNYLSETIDVTTIIEGIRFVQKMMKTKAFQALNPELIRINWADCDNVQFDSDAYWDCAIRNLIRTAYHFVGTCKMGPKSDPSAVVDSRLRVHDIKGLRVIDGSIMPSLVGVHTNGPIIVIGEKGAEMVKEDWGINRNEL